MSACRLSLIACNGCLASALMCVTDLFSNANRLAQQSSSNKPEKTFDVTIVSPDGQQVRCSNGYSIQVDGGIELVDRSDIVIFYPPLDCDQQLQNNTSYYLQTLLPKLKNNIRQMQMFIVDKSDQSSTLQSPLANIISSVSPAKWFDVCLSIIEQKLDKSIVSALSDYWKPQPESTLDTQMHSTVQTVESSNVIVSKAQAWIETNLSNRFGVEDVAEHVAVSTRTLIRYFQHCLGKSPLNYIQQSRIEKCKTLLRTTRFSFTKITAMCGYKDESAFRKLFKKNCYLSPAQYRRQNLFRPNTEHLNVEK